MHPSSNRLLAAALTGAVGAVGVALGSAHTWVNAGLKGRILDLDDESLIEADLDAIVVLGARIGPSGQPSAMLEDRLITASKIWHRLHDAGIDTRLVVTGTDGRDGQVAETGFMKDYLLDLGVPESVLDVDPSGLSTMRSASNLADRFNNIIVISQRFHLPRTIFNFHTVAQERALALNVRGVAADRRDYNTALKANVREVFASLKDAALALRNQSR